jgi:cystathionine gamma-lyase
MVWIESPTNPLLNVIDIQAVSDMVHRISPSAIVVVDNTFLSPYFQRPLNLGADIVVHSTSKYINGHSDVIGGVAVTRNADINSRLRELQGIMGGIPSPFDSYLTIRGTKTLRIRMLQHEQNAFAVARFLESHPKIEHVIYPGLPSHPQHELAKRQQSGFGGMVSARIEGGLTAAKVFLESLKVFSLAVSLGGVESLIEHPALMTHASVPEEHRLKIGVTDNLIRISVGIEDVQDLLDDLAQALDKI